MDFPIKRMLAPLFAASVIALGSAETAEAGSKWKPGHAVGFQPANPSIQVGSPYRFQPRVHPRRGFLTPIRRAPAAQHVHAFQVVVERRWCPPAYRDVTIGFDPCGTPITRAVMVTPGAYKLARYKICGCGSKVFLGWV